MVDFNAKLKEMKEGVKVAKPISVDFTSTEDSGGFYVTPGTYPVKCIKITQEVGEKAPYLDFLFEVQGRGVQIHNRCTLKPDALFNLKNTLGALMGRDIPKAVIKIDPDKLIGRVCTATIDDREYNGKVYSNITRLMPYEVPTASAPSTIPVGGGTPTDDLDDDLPF